MLQVPARTPTRAQMFISVNRTTQSPLGQLQLENRSFPVSVLPSNGGGCNSWELTAGKGLGVENALDAEPTQKL